MRKQDASELSSAKMPKTQLFHCPPDDIQNALLIAMK